MESKSEGILVIMLSVILISAISFCYLIFFEKSHLRDESTSEEQYQTLEKTLIGHSKGLADISWSPDGKMIISVAEYENWGEECEIKVWNSTSGEEVCTLKPPYYNMRVVDWNIESPQYVAVANSIWNSNTWKLDILLDCNWIVVTSVKWSNDGKYIAIGGGIYEKNGEIKIFETNTWKIIKLIRGHSTYVDDIEWTRNGDKLISSSWDGSIIVWNTSSWEQEIVLNISPFISSIEISSKDEYLAVASGDTIQIFETNSWQNIINLTGQSDWIRDIAWSPNNKYIISGSSSGSLDFKGEMIIWNTLTWEIISKNVVHDDTIVSICWKIDNSCFATASWDKTIKIWKL